MATLTMYIQAFCRSVIILVFASAFLGKVRSVGTFQQTIADFALLPAWLNRPAAWLCLFSEALVVALLLPGGLLLVPGYLLASAVLLLFCLAMGSVLWRHLATTCSCFGPSTTPISPTDLVRNTGFIACAVTGCFTLPATAYGLASLNLAEWSVMGAGALVFVLIWTSLGEIVRLFS